MTQQTKLNRILTISCITLMLVFAMALNEAIKSDVAYQHRVNQ